MTIDVFLLEIRCIIQTFVYQIIMHDAVTCSKTTKKTIATSKKNRLVTEVTFISLKTM